MSFDVEIGHASRSGPRDTNEDYAAATRSAPSDRVRGLIAAIADGVSGGGRGLEAAQTSVLGLLADFFATPPTVTSESAILTRWNGQLYTVLGQPDGSGRWQVRLWWKPFVTLIWAGGGMIALGGLLALVGRWWRTRRQRRAWN